MSKILLFDIETSPNISYVWGQWEQNVIEHLHQNHLLCFSYKWLGESKVHAMALPDFSGYRKDMRDDTKLAKELHKLFDEADVIVAHNGDSFDIKKANTYFAKAGLPPPSPYKTVDTKKEAKKYFKFNSNKLDHLGEYLGLGRKLDTGGFELWEGCMAGDKKSWDKMVKYNKQDVVLLEKVYLKLLPWMKTHPHTYGDCKNCGGDHMQKRGFNISKNKRTQRLQCQDCGAWTVMK